MTDKTSRFLKSALQWGVLLIPALGGAWSIAKAVGATKLDVTVYQRDRAVDSLNLKYQLLDIGRAVSRTDSTVNEIRACLKNKSCQ